MKLGLVLLIFMIVPLVVGAIERARMRAGISHKELAICQGISQAQWSQQLAGQGHIALDRLFEAPGSFWDYLTEEIRAVKCGGVHTIEDLYRLLSASRPRVARASRSIAQKAEVV